MLARLQNLLYTFIVRDAEKSCDNMHKLSTFLACNSKNSFRKIPSDNRTTFITKPKAVTTNSNEGDGVIVCFYAVIFVAKIF